MDVATTVAHLIDHVLQLSLGGILSERAHHGTQLLRGDRSIAVYSLRAQ